jgi:hypothetical protein
MSDQSAWKVARRTRDTIKNRQRYRKNSFDTRSNIVAVTAFTRISTAC